MARSAKTADLRALLSGLQKRGPGLKTDLAYKFWFQVLADADFLDALGRDDLVGARNSLSAACARLYLDSGQAIPESVRGALARHGAKVPTK